MLCVGPACSAYDILAAGLVSLAAFVPGTYKPSSCCSYPVASVDGAVYVVLFACLCPLRPQQPGSITIQQENTMSCPATKVVCSTVRRHFITSGGTVYRVG
ncbi:hypothetical protein LY76DRAFT_585785 [Colletotrichum caudatum]|nr:hypothetical protein LY76DRAFT_585785 [Colletotrichum caudatum]